MELKPRDLIENGWDSDGRLAVAVKRGRALEAAGVPRAKMLSLLAAEFPKRAVLVQPLPASRPLAEAISASSGLDESAIGQARTRMLELLQMPVVRRGALMPDTCPVMGGPATIPVGGAIEVENAIMPGAHSADICCSMFATFFEANYPVGRLMDHLQAVTHFGPGGRPRDNQFDSAVLREAVWNNPFLSGLETRALEHLGTQGDGNHFAFLGRARFAESEVKLLRKSGYGSESDAIDRAQADFHVLVTHHGSRGFGADVFARGHKAAREWCKLNTKDIPDAAVWLPADSETGNKYWEALQYVGRWTRENHRVIHEAFLRRVGLRAGFQVANAHNFVWRRGDMFLHGKGATPAWRDDSARPLLGLIPLNMAHEILLVLGGDNDQFLSFAPHGAGRNRSRSATLDRCRKELGSLEPEAVRRLLAQQTPGLDIRWFSGNADLSESPLGYKDPVAVRTQIESFGLAKVVAGIRPLGSIMAGSNEVRKRETDRVLKAKETREERRRSNQAVRRGEFDEV